MKIGFVILTVAAGLWFGNGSNGSEVSPKCCLGYSQPAASCKTCETCYYCGKKGRWGKRPENSATCSVCDAAKSKGKQP